MKVLKEKLVRRFRCMKCYALIEFEQEDIFFSTIRVSYGSRGKKCFDMQMYFCKCPVCGEVSSPQDSADFSETLVVTDGEN